MMNQDPGIRNNTGVFFWFFVKSGGKNPYWRFDNVKSRTSIYLILMTTNPNISVQP